jgi:hypothetical protein
MKQQVWLTAIVGALLLAMPAILAAETIVPATFADGKGSFTATNGPITTDNTVNNVVDALMGMAGEGWKAGWGYGCGGSSTLTETVVDVNDTGYAQLVDANYLQYRFSTAATSSRHSCLYRDYETYQDLSPDADHTIEFTIRIMENLASTPGTSGRFRHSQDKYEIHDRQFSGASYTYAASECTWGVSVSGDNKKWQIKSVTYDEFGTPTAISTDTGITISQNTPLSFKLDFDMSAGYNGVFDVTIKNAATQEQLYAGTGFGLSQAVNAGGYSRETTGRVLFTGFANNDYVTGSSGTREGTNYRSWDIDAIKITAIPEPAAVAMCLGMLLMALARHRRK